MAQPHGREVLEDLSIVGVVGDLKSVFNGNFVSSSILSEQFYATHKDQQARGQDDGYGPKSVVAPFVF